jgi:type I restriction enzyme R subunit
MKYYKYIESDLEEAILEWIGEDLGYSIAFGPDIAPDGEYPERKSYKEVVLANRLKVAIEKINPNIPKDAQEEAIKKIVNIAYSSPNLLTTNQDFHRMVFEGIDVGYSRKDGSIAGDKVYLFDADNLENNDWLAVNQFTVIENNHNRRPDIIIFINGLPIAIFELKNPADTNATIKSAFNQIQTYKSEIPSLFTYNEFCILADHIKNAVIGTISSDMDRFMGWKSVDGKNIVKTNDLEILIKGIFAKDRVFDIIKNFIVFEKEKD